MEIFIAVLLLIVGFVLLVKGADFFVDGASNISKYLKVPTLIIGLTVVAFGTSLPEAAVSVTSALQNVDDVSLGNVVGSNIFNLLLILGISALISPIFVDKQIVKRDLPYSIIAALLLIVAVYILHLEGNPALVRLEGFILLIFFSLYMFITIRNALKNQTLDTNIEKEEKNSKPTLSRPKSIIFVLLGLIGIVLGGILVTDNARKIALTLGMSEWLVGLTIVSIGTSLPELVTSIVAAIKKENDIAVGNVVGSNIFNILFVLGISSLISPITFTTEVLFDLIFLIIGSIIILGIAFFKKGKLNRFDGALLTLMYIGYFVYIIVRDFR